MITKLRNTLLRFLNSTKDTPILAGFSAGLYPVLFYYNNNYGMANSMSHLLFFIGTFIVGPTLVLFAVRKIFSHTTLYAYRKYVIPFFSVFTFLFLLMVCVYAEIHETKVLGALLIAGIFALIAHRHYKKLIVLQLILTVVVSARLVPDVYRHITSDAEWRKLTVDEQHIAFTKKPNIYMIQPDGYVNSAELKKGYYTYNNAVFEDWLTGQGFWVYEDFRSNYYSTLSSNSSLFGMKHHYYQNTGCERKDIVGKNNALEILKQNGYTTSLLLELEYLIFNRTPLYYDFCNIAPEEMNFIGRGLSLRKDLIPEIKRTVNTAHSQPQFFFIEHIYPTHIATGVAYSQGIEGEKKAYLERLENTNIWLKEILQTITEADPQGIIILIADHGGFVGMKATSESVIKTQDRDKIYSMFSTQLAIKWPEDYTGALDRELVSSVNFFRVLFSYLSDTQVLLQHKEEDASYIQLQKNAPAGVYEYIAGDGTIRCKKIDI